MHTIYQPWVHKRGAYLNTEQILDTRTRANKYRKSIGGETGLTWPIQFHNIINSRLAQGWFFSPSNSLRSCTLLWWIFCTITDYCHGNRCITWQLCYLRDKKQLLKETGILQEWGYFIFFFFCWPHIGLGVLTDFLMDAASIILVVKNVSVHQLKVIFSHVIFFPLTKKSSICLKKRKKKYSSSNFGRSKVAFFLPHKHLSLVLPFCFY